MARQSEAHLCLSGRPHASRKAIKDTDTLIHIKAAPCSLPLQPFRFSAAVTRLADL